MNIVDSSGWLEYFAGSRRARHFASAIQATDQLLVPVICLYEVYKVVRREQGESAALTAVAYMQEGESVDITRRLALTGAQLSLTHGLPMADSLILAVAHQYRATLYTQDADFKGLAGVKYFAPH